MPDHTERVREAVDGARDAFEERVRWFYANAPECQEARRHSFSRQRDMAFVLARNEDRAAVRAAVLAEVAQRMDEAASEARHAGAHFEAVEAYTTARNIILFRAHMEATDGR